MTNRPPELLKISDIRRLYGISRAFIKKLLIDKKIRCLRLDGYKIRIKRIEIENWIEKNLQYYQRVESNNPKITEAHKQRKELIHEQKD